MIEKNSENIKQIIEGIEKHAAAAQELRDEIIAAYDRSDLAFLKQISKSLSELEAASYKVVQAFEEIDEILKLRSKMRDEGIIKQYHLRRA